MSQVPNTPPDAAPAAPAAVPAATFTPDQFAQIIAAMTSQGFNKDDLREILSESQKATATMVDRVANPSNKVHPGKSAMSYPEGDVARPRPRVEHSLFWNGYPQHKFQEELHWSELELFVQLKAGEYDCMQKDGRTSHKVSVKVQRDANERVERMDVTFPVLREYKERIPPLYVWLYQMVHADTMKPRQSFMKGMASYIDLMYEDEEAKRSDADAVAV